MAVVAWLNTLVTPSQTTSLAIVAIDWTLQT